MTDRKMRMKDPETVQWVKLWPQAAGNPEADKAKAPPANKSRGKAPENKKG